jgi:hypothetical protein
MAVEWLFAIMLGALAVILFGSVWLFRRRVTGETSGGGAHTFKDCYELCAREGDKPLSVSCATMCATTGTV